MPANSAVNNLSESTPKVSIITVSFNSSSTIRETIESVLAQDYPNLEYIIVDGDSTDGTQSIIEEYRSRIAVYVSEKDQGLYDAMNKAIGMATGDVVGILNSDDVYADHSILSQVMSHFRSKNIDCVFGDLYYFSGEDKDKPLRYYRGKNFSRWKIRLGITPPHPTFFVRRSVYEKYGAFDLQYRYAADFDLMARFLYVKAISYAYLPVTMVKMRMGGVSTGSFRRLIEINREDLRSCRNLGIRTNFMLFHFKYFSKILEVTNLYSFFSEKIKLAKASQE
jgi:glycosyltransferase involved in cell wall biosynthesis